MGERVVNSYHTSRIPDLFEYGIMTEGSDIRAHVSDRVFYIFQTPLAIDVIMKGSSVTRLIARVV